MKHFFLVTVVHGCDNFFGLKQVAKTHLITAGSRAAFWIISYYYSKVAKKLLFKATITEFPRKIRCFFTIRGQIQILKNLLQVFAMLLYSKYLFSI